MTTLLAYVERYQHLTFQEKALNEVDIIILNEMVYFPLNNFISSSFDLNSAMRLEDFAVQFEPFSKLFNQINWVLTTPKRINLLKTIAKTERYRDVRLVAFQEQIDLASELQFAAVSLLLPLGASEEEYQLQVSFRGTDDSLAGWKEDANMVFQVEVPSQQLAVSYLEKVASFSNKRLILSGHSKGGNLAIFASTFVANEIQDRIEAIYSFDGPGLHLITLENDGYPIIQDRIHLYLPEDSIVGMMLHHTATPRIIKSRKRGFNQHLVTNWLVQEDRLNRSQGVSINSQLFDQTLREWTAAYTGEEMEYFVNHSFNLLLKTKAQSIVDITDHKMRFIRLFTQEMALLNPDVRQVLDQQLSHLVRIALNIMLTNRRQQYQDNLKLFNRWLNQVSALESVKWSLPSLRAVILRRQKESKDTVKEKNQIRD